MNEPTNDTVSHVLPYAVDLPKQTWRKPLAISLSVIAVTLLLAGFVRGIQAIFAMEAMYPNRAEGRFTFVLAVATFGQTMIGGFALTLSIAALLIHWRNKWTWLLAVLTLLLFIGSSAVLRLYFEHAMNKHGYVEID